MWRGVFDNSSSSGGLSRALNKEPFIVFCNLLLRLLLELYSKMPKNKKTEWQVGDPAISVVSDQFCNPYPMDLLVKRKVQNFSKDYYEVFDPSGNLLLQIDGQAWGFNRKRVMRDPAGFTILSMRQKVTKHFNFSTNIHIKMTLSWNGVWLFRDLRWRTSGKCMEERAKREKTCSSRYNNLKRFHWKHPWMFSCRRTTMSRRQTLVIFMLQEDTPISHSKFSKRMLSSPG